jgi:zinc transporter, ZIP family
MLLGAVVLWAIHRYLPHEHFIKGREGMDAANLRRIWLFVFAIGLHNLPEGLAVGVGVGGDRSADGAAGLAITLGIALQNMPEGLIVAVALAGEGYSRGFAFMIAVLSGLVEPIAGLFGAFAVNIAGMMLPWGLAFAAGAMLFVISDEIVPETHRRGHATEATFGLMTGFVFMMMLSALVV